MSADPIKDRSEIEPIASAPPSVPKKLDLHAQREHSLVLARTAVAVAADNRGQDIVLLDLTQQTSLFDFFVIVTGTSRRQLGAICIEVDRVLKTQFGERKLSMTGQEDGRWTILDYGNIVVHVFDEETRQFYDLESLWGDAKQIDVTDIINQSAARMSPR
jgi:ribosome-associated protein